MLGILLVLLGILFLEVGRTAQYESPSFKAVRVTVTLRPCGELSMRFMM